MFSVVTVVYIGHRCIGVSGVLYFLVYLQMCACMCVFISVRTPEESILRSNKVLLKYVKGGSTKADAYIHMRVDRNTIVMQAPIAELAADNPEIFSFKKGNSLQKFAAKCVAQCVEPNAGLIAAMKEANHLLDIGKK